jgi:galactonate dehydratase
VIEKQAVALLQPDVAHCGGISELKRIANMAEVYYMHVMPHCAIGPVAFSACMQVDACVPNFLIQEQVDVGLGGGLLKKDWVVKNGHIELPKGPGLGFDIEEKEATKILPRHREELGGPEWVHESDGSVADW